MRRLDAQRRRRRYSCNAGGRRAHYCSAWSRSRPSPSSPSSRCVAPLAVAFTRPAAARRSCSRSCSGSSIGPQVLGWASDRRAGAPCMSMIGLAFLLLLAGLEIDFERLRGRLLRLTLIGYVVSFGHRARRSASACARATSCARRCSSRSSSRPPGSASSSRSSRTPARRRPRSARSIVAGASIAEVGPIVLLSLFFSGESGGLGVEARPADRVLRVRRRGRLRHPRARALDEGLADARCSCRTRPPRSACEAPSCCSRVFVFLASKFGLEAILGAFLAGATLKLVDRDEGMTHAFFHAKLRGRRLRRLRARSSSSRPGSSSTSTACSHSSSTLARVPLFLAALLVVRALPAVLYRPFAERGRNSSPAGCCRRRRSDPGRRRPDRRRPRAHPARELRRARRRRAALGDRLPARRADAAARPPGDARGRVRRNRVAASGDRGACAHRRSLASLAAFAVAAPSADGDPAPQHGRRRQVGLRPGALRRPRLRPLRLHARPRRYAARAAARAPGPGRRISCAAAVRRRRGRYALAARDDPPRRRLAAGHLSQAGRSTTTSATATPGQILCQNVSEFGGLWLVVRASGAPVR